MGLCLSRRQAGSDDSKRSRLLTRAEWIYASDLFKRYSDSKEGISWDACLAFLEPLSVGTSRFFMRYYFGGDGKSPDSAVRSFIPTCEDFMELFINLARAGVTEKAEVMVEMLRPMDEDDLQLQTRRLKNTSSTNIHTFVARMVQRMNSGDISALFPVVHPSQALSSKHASPFFEDGALYLYLKGLWRSYLKHECLSRHVDFRSWVMVAGARFTPDDVRRIAATQAAECHQPMLLKYIERWVMKWRTLRHLHSVVLGHLFGIDDNIEMHISISVLPFCRIEDSHQRYIPNTGCILDICAITGINCYIPSQCRRQWYLIHASYVHGHSFQKVLEHILDIGPTIIVVEDRMHHVFGGFTDTSWTLKHGGKFFGDFRCFTFNVYPTFKLFETSVFNNNYMYLNATDKHAPLGIGMGGQVGYFGWFVDHSLTKGTCTPKCTTFEDMTQPAGALEFDIKHIEVWALHSAAPEVILKRRIRRTQGLIATIRHDHYTKAEPADAEIRTAANFVTLVGRDPDTDTLGKREAVEPIEDSDDIPELSFSYEDVMEPDSDYDLHKPLMS